MDMNPITPHAHYIEAVTVCVGCHDFLDVVAPFNIPHIDRWIIVTEEKDLQTREVCRKYGLECLLSDDAKYHNGDGFNKGRLVERGLQHTSAGGWRLHIDSDIVLPVHFRYLLQRASLQEDTIYGVDRIMVKTYDDWLRLLSTGYLKGGQYGYSHAIHFPPGFTLGTRWAGATTGYVPIGFFQLWHSTQDEWRGMRIKPYPIRHGDACRSDVQHGLQWDRSKREILPEVVVVHLESELTAKGANWNGRITKRFGPPGPADETYAKSVGS